MSVGGHQYTDSLQKEFELSFDMRRLQAGARRRPQSRGGASNGVLQQVTEILVLEIQKTLDFFRASAGGEHIEKMTGRAGPARCRACWNRCGWSSPVPVEMLNPVSADRHSGEQLRRPNWWRPTRRSTRVGVGLALRSFESL